MRRFKSIIQLIFLLLILFVSAYALDKFDVRFKQNVRSISEDAVRDIVENALAAQLQTGSYYRASVRVYSDGNARADFFAVYLYKKDNLLLECYKIDLNEPGNIVSVTGDFREPYNEEDLIPCGTCPDPDMEVYVETAMDGVPAGAALWCYNEAVNAGYKAALDLAAAATSKRFKDYLSCPKLKCAIHVGHGNTWVIAFATDIITNEWFDSLPAGYLKGQVHMYGSCLAHNDPLEPAVLKAGVKAYMSGDVTLDIQYLQNTMFTISRAMFNGTEVGAAFKNSDAPSRGWGISGNPPAGPWYIKDVASTNSIGDPYPSLNLLSCNSGLSHPDITIRYTVNKSKKTAENVRLDIYATSGRLVETLVNESKQTGKYTITWNAAERPNGLYLLKLSVGEKEIVKSTLLLR